MVYFDSLTSYAEIIDVCFYFMTGHFVLSSQIYTYYMYIYCETFRLLVVESPRQTIPIRCHCSAANLEFHQQGNRQCLPRVPTLSCRWILKSNS